MSGTLFLVGTPIGNIEDLSPRARRILGEVDVVAAEDTRRTGQLLQRLGIRARLVSYFEGNEEKRTRELVGMLRDGQDVAVVTDGGMPGISDPGYRVVRACIDAEVAIDVVPGPSAVVTALVVSGLPTDRFVFEGFLPRSGRARTERLEALARERRTAVLFESPNRVVATLGHLLETCGDRDVAVVRELTKLHQEVVRGRLSDLAASLGDLRGEVVVVLAGADPEPPDEEAALALARRLVDEGASKREASREAARATGLAARAIYARLIDPEM